MTTDCISLRREPTRDDLYRGGHALIQLLEGMPEQSMRGCRLEIIDDRADMVMIAEDGREVSGWGWTVMDTLGANQGSARSRPRLLPRSNRPLARNRLELRNLNLPPEDRAVDPGLGEMTFVIDGRWGLLPPAVPSLRCYCAVLPGPKCCARLQILSQEEAQADLQAAADQPPDICWRIP